MANVIRQMHLGGGLCLLSLSFWIKSDGGHCWICLKNDNGKMCQNLDLNPFSIDLHPSKTLFSLDSDNTQLQCVLGLGTLFCLFCCPLYQPCKMLQMVRAAPPCSPEQAAN